MRRVRLKKQQKRLDRNLFLLTIILTIVGLIALADSSAPMALNNFGDKFYFVKQQLGWGIIGLILLMIFSKIHYSIWEKLAIPIFFASIVTLVLVLIPGVGTKILGARRWIVTSYVTFQPSELVKLTLAVYLAKVASKEKRLLAYFIPISVVAFLIMLQPDLGTAIVVSAIGLVQIYLSGINLIYLVAAGIVSAGMGLLLILISDYRRDRLLTFLEQTQDPLGKGYHIRQILFALGSGGFLGVGLGQSRQKFLFLPEAATDSIFAVIAEEAGFLGASGVILLFAAYLYIGFRIAKNAPDNFSQILSAGLVTWIGGQAFLNIASMVAAVPLTGIPLPFFSYGGSSLTTVLIATGILLNISRHSSKHK